MVKRTALRGMADLFPVKLSSVQGRKRGIRGEIRAAQVI